MATTGSQIQAADLNALGSEVTNVLGTGSGTFGYGQSVQTYTVTPGQTARKADFDAIRFDLFTIYNHQVGSTPSVVEAFTNIPIQAGAGDPINAYTSLNTTLKANRFDVGNFQGAVSVGTDSYTSSWTTSLSAEFTATFATAEQARIFFNTGSKIRILTSQVGGSGTPQVNAWRDILTNAGSQEFGAGTNPTINYYTLTNSYQQYYSLSTSTPYSANNYILEAKTDVADNSAGTARILTIRVRLDDSYVDPGPPSPGDLVDGTFSFSVEELVTAATLFPSSSSFSITSPTYSSINITAS